MKVAKISQLKNDLSNYLHYVRKGGKVRVLDRNEPVADIVPVAPMVSGTTEEVDAFLRILEAKGIVRRGGAQISKDLLTPPQGPYAGALKALLDERNQGR